MSKWTDWWILSEVYDHIWRMEYSEEGDCEYGFCILELSHD